MPTGGDWKDLFAAVQRDDMDTVRYHILMGIDPNYQHPEFLTNPLIEAVRFERLEIVRYLLENGAQANVKEIWSGESLLKIAQITNNRLIIQLIKTYL